MDRSQEEHDCILFLTEWTIQKHLSPIDEMYDTNIKLEDVDMHTDFGVKFYANDGYYLFGAKKIDDVYMILFYKSGSNTGLFDLKQDKTYVGNVISGVFRAIKRLIEVKNVTKFAFRSDVPELIRFYDKLTRYIELRFDFVLDNREKRNNTVQWTYGKK